MPNATRCSQKLKPARVPGAKQVIRTIACVQLLVTLVATLLAFGFGDARAAYSALVGGGISTLATLCFAAQVFSARIGSSAAKIARAFLVGEIGKILLTVVLLSIAFLWLEVSPLPLLLAYMAALMAYWLALPFTFDASVRTL